MKLRKGGINVKSIVESLKQYGKYCPRCRSGQITTINNETPLRHRCLSCNYVFLDDKAIIRS